ncbi:DUF4253 domain-containing protein [Phytohabitans flavus]|uniref:DUF4253 domain-containing protein n=1 Tax=Phytohabitans flavus TaxID=1076124 RepID=A0A6F8XWY9_9ACTN|nr:hypothetical protein Pflav_047550 [Phytohabitans flavus]
MALPSGRLVHGDEGEDEDPALWVSDGPAGRELWAVLHTAHERTGLWPLLLDSLRGDSRRPWDDGELGPRDVSSAADGDPEALLAGWWADYTSIDDADRLSPAERRAVTAPYEQRWPGLAMPLPLRHDPGELAERCVTELLAGKAGLRLGLVAATRSSDAIAVVGWQGAVNYIGDAAHLSAVLSSWEDRFGVRLVGVGFAELYLSVAAPPTSDAEAIRVAAEHFAFCPDNIWQSSTTNLVDYAKRLIDATIWSFWWD